MMLSWLKRLINMSVYNVPTVSLNNSTTATLPSATWSNVSITSSTTFNINTVTNAALVINNRAGGAVLTIHYDGRIEYTGKPSDATEAFLKSLSSHIDWKAAGTLALEKTYRRAINKCLNQAKSMTHEEFINTLERELNARTSKAVLKILTED